MGVFGSGDKISTSEDNRIVAQNNAVVTAGTRNIGPGSVGVSGGIFTQAGGVTISKGVKLSKGSALTVNLGDGGAGVAAVSQQFNDTLSKMNAGLNTQFGQVASALTGAIGDISDLSMSSQTDGEAGKNNIVLYIGLALLAVVGIFFWRMGK